MQEIHLNKSAVALAERILTGQIEKGGLSLQETSLKLQDVLRNSEEYAPTFSRSFNIPLDAASLRGVCAEVMLGQLLKAYTKKNVGVAYTTNVLLGVNNNMTTQIDALLFLRKSIVCIEAKSYRGDITVTGDGIRRGGSTIKVFDQNEKHIKHLYTNLPKELRHIPIYNAVYLFSIATVKNSGKLPDNYIWTHNRNFQTIMNYLNQRNEQSVKDKHVKQAYTYLKQHISTLGQDIKHVENIQKINAKK